MPAICPRNSIFQLSTASSEDIPYSHIGYYFRFRVPQRRRASGARGPRLRPHLPPKVSAVIREFDAIIHSRRQIIDITSGRRVAVGARSPRPTTSRRDSNVGTLRKSIIVEQVRLDGSAAPTFELFSPTAADDRRLTRFEKRPLFPICALAV